MLAAIAAVCDVRLKRVRNIAVHWAKITDWAETDDKPELFWPTIKRVLTRIGHADVYDLLAMPYMNPPPTSSRGKELPDDITDFPVIGRGVVIVQGGCWGTHIMPWENGFAFDPNVPSVPITLTHIRDCGASVLRITQIDPLPRKDR
jgi:hypothetical protein